MFGTCPGGATDSGCALCARRVDDGRLSAYVEVLEGVLGVYTGC
jgi:hypothetical protein